ncbi:Putative ribosomal N-acetyltransferase YdaF [Paenibacillus auburnensis]|uniref:Ribosomal N-acetyltransferase YdaF n=1 Tax=Paenibacillus auburnensis TaxID=2905649 RepID=A0ABN8H4M8_9BACL|nr:GNAT family N-acetyltransferase [Paenibacillus auburnensis]CAH1222698.1 Putative ribosomal N-acetyltransferase YdaF [Paenibacillus auburnensis]
MENAVAHPILLSFPESFESERLLIRAPLWGDGAAVNTAILESLDELRPWMPWARHLPTPEQAEAIIRKSRLEFLERKDLRLLLLHKTSGEIIGSSGLHRIDWQTRKFEIGYWVRSSYSRQGYITEAVHAITNYAIQELQANRIEIRCDTRNTPSARVAERSGFTLEGILRSDKCDVDGKLRDTMIFAKVRGVEY